MKKILSLLSFLFAANAFAITLAPPTLVTDLHIPGEYPISGFGLIDLMNGANGTCLEMVGGVPTWVTCPGGGGAGFIRVIDGSRASPIAVTSAGITLSTDTFDEMKFYMQGSGGPVTIGPSAPAGPPAGSPAFGTARSYAALGGSAVTGSAAPGTNLTGNLGIFPSNCSSVTNFPPSTFTGIESCADSNATAAQSSAQAAYTDLSTRTASTIATALDGQSLTAGVYKAASGTFTLDGGGALTLTGSATDIFVFQTTTTLVTGSSGIPVITLAGGVLASNIYWAIGSAATLNSGFAGTFYGNVIANTGAVTVTTGGGDVRGTLAALTSAVTFSNPTTVEVQGFSSPTGNPSLGTARTYGLLANTAISNTGPSVVTGNIGINPTSCAGITGFPPGTFTGTKDCANAAAIAAQTSAQSAYADLATRPASTISSTLDGQTLSAGVYKFASGSATLANSGNATLTFSGSNTDVFVIQLTGTLVTGNGGIATMAFVGAVNPANIYWVNSGSTTINQVFPGTFQGNVIDVNGITVTAGGTVDGSLISLNTSDTLVDGGGTIINTETLTPPVPSITPCTTDGQILILTGRSATNTVTLNNGNGFSLNGQAVFGLDDTMTLTCDLVNFVESSRSF